jgi:hypothetical protein
MNNAGAGEERAQPVDALPRLLGYAIRAPRADFYCFLLKPQLPGSPALSRKRDRHPPGRKLGSANDLWPRWKVARNETRSAAPGPQGD